MINRLVKKGLVERIGDESDRRAVLCRLTPLGEETVGRFWSMGHTRIKAFADVLSVKELEIIVPAMVVLAEAAGRLEHPRFQEDHGPDPDVPESSRESVPSGS